MKYNVYVWYGTCVQVEADDEKEAGQLARETLVDTDDETFREIIEISDVEVKEVDVEEDE